MSGHNDCLFTDIFPIKLFVQSNAEVQPLPLSVTGNRTCRKCRGALQQTVNDEKALSDPEKF